MSNTVIVEFYRTDNSGSLVVCRTEFCMSLLEADFLISEEMKTGQYHSVKIKEKE